MEPLVEQLVSGFSLLTAACQGVHGGVGSAGWGCMAWGRVCAAQALHSTAAAGMQGDVAEVVQ